jgi:GT2 family glycosyltransferase
VLALEYDNFECVIVSPKSYAPEYSGCRTVSPEGEDYPLAHNINFGARSADPASKYFCFINDDCEMARDSLALLVHSLSRRPQVGLLMPISNDTNLGSYALAKVRYPPGMIFKDTLCLFAFLIRREVFNKVGEWDERLLGMDDVDYSWRVRQAGYLNAIELSAYVRHEGGVTTSSKSAEWRAESERIFNAKWSRQGGVVRGLNDE